MEKTESMDLKSLLSPVIESIEKLIEIEKRKSYNEGFQMGSKTTSQTIDAAFSLLGIK